MINFQALSVLLDTLRKPEPRPLPVARVLPIRMALRTADGAAAPADTMRRPPAATPPRTAPRDFPIAPDPTSGGRFREPLANTRLAAQVLLSSGGAELERALRGTPARPPDAPTIRGNAPLIESPPPALAGDASDFAVNTATARSVTLLAAALRGAVSYSGLFYESHLAGWIAGEVPQAELEHEPQAASHAQAFEPDAMPANRAAAALLIADAMGASPTSAAAAATESAPPPLLRQQLDLLDTRQFIWVGEAWPGQRTAITFEEDHEGLAANGPMGKRPPVRAHVILELPQLGTVGAELTIVEGSVHLQITTDGPQATARLHAARAELAEALAARAVPAAEIAVFHEL